MKWKKKIQKFEYLESENSFLDKIKSIFLIIEWLSFGEKIKNSRQSFKMSVPESLERISRLRCHQGGRGGGGGGD